MIHGFQHKYRKNSIRLEGWNYGLDGGYFVTICSFKRICCFGKVVWKDDTATVELSAVGQIAHDRWLEIPDNFPYVRLGEFVVMPNHIHGIVIIDKSGARMEGNYRDPVSPQQTQKKIGGITENHNPMLHDNLSRIIRWYKGGTTFESRKIQSDFAWQSRFHDNVIADGDAFNRISEYIKNNPKKWRDDEYNNDHAN